MQEELENTEQLEETSEAESVKTEKKFSEKDVQRLITERVSREKASSKRLQEEFESKESEYKTQLESYESVLKKMLEAQVNDLPESVKKLLGKLTVLEQLEWLSDENNHIEKRAIPSTPKEKGEPQIENRKFRTYI